MSRATIRDRERKLVALVRDLRVQLQAAEERALEAGQRLANISLTDAAAKQAATAERAALDEAAAIRRVIETRELALAEVRAELEPELAANRLAISRRLTREQREAAERLSSELVEFLERSATGGGLKALLEARGRVRQASRRVRGGLMPLLGGDVPAAVAHVLVASAREWQASAARSGAFHDLPEDPAFAAELDALL